MTDIRHSSVYARSLVKPVVQVPVKKDEILDVGQVMKRLNCSKSFVYSLIESGALKHLVLGSGVRGKRVKESDLDDYLDKKTAEAGAE